MKSEIKQFIKSTLRFILFSLIMYVMFDLVVSEVVPYQCLKPNINYKIGSYGHLFSRIKEIKEHENADILFLGSSHAYRSFDTRIYEKQGFSSFNLGSSSQTPIQTEVLLNRHLDFLNPKIVIFEVSPMQFTLDGAESSMDLMANEKNDLLTITKLIQWDNIKTINTAIVGFYKDLLDLNNDFIEEKRKGDDLYIFGGFVEKDMKHYKLIKQNKKNIDLNKNQIIAFKKIVELVQSKNIKLFLVQAPITKSLYNSYSDNEQFDEIMMSNGIYYDFNKMLNLNETLCFYNEDHMNQNGVVIFNNKMLQILKNNMKELTYNTQYEKVANKW